MKNLTITIECKDERTKESVATHINYLAKRLIDGNFDFVLSKSKTITFDDKKQSIKSQMKWN